MSKFPGFHKLSSQPVNGKITLNFNYIKSYEYDFKTPAINSNGELSDEFLKYMERISKEKNHKDILTIKLLKTNHIYHTHYDNMSNSDSKKIIRDYYIKIKSVWISDFYIKGRYPVLYESEKIRIDKEIEHEIFNIEISEDVYNFNLSLRSWGKDIGTTHPEEVKKLIQNFIL